MSVRRQQEPIPFQKFRRVVAETLEVDEARVVPEASFMDDLLADSIQLVGLILQFESEGIEIPLEAAWQIRTVGDAYRLYNEHAALAGPGG